ncbi:MAG: alpha/beta hydrolase [bacterium]
MKSPLLASIGGYVGEPATSPLWPEGAPGARGEAAADRPELTVHLPPAGTANGSAMVIFPGGGYGDLMMSYEGHDLAAWLNGYGVAGIVLKYRVSPYRHPIPLLDAKHALRTVRLHAREWGLAADRIGVMGFSAGGHLAATLATQFDAGDPQAADPVARQSCRPDFAILVYPVITMGEQTHGGSRDNLLGPNATLADRELLSNERQVTARTPPTFLAHSVQDSTVSVANSRLFYAALQASGVPAEFLELPTGDHGLGCGQGAEWADWQAGCLAWLNARHLLDV